MGCSYSYHVTGKSFWAETHVLNLLPSLLSKYRPSTSRTESREKMIGCKRVINVLPMVRDNGASPFPPLHPASLETSAVAIETRDEVYLVHP
ncbi:hypothetical protein BgiBS90_008800, partial [Biomphalaria glabrata]